MRGAGQSKLKERRDPIRQALAIALRLTKRSAQIKELQKLLFFLTNDTRTLIEFDRSFLIVHLGGESYCAAVNNQPHVEKKSAFAYEFNQLAPFL